MYSLWMASRRIAGLSIEAFEPDPDLCESLRFNLSLNELSQVTLHEVALGEVRDRFVLKRGLANLGTNSVCKDGEGIEVQVLPLLEVLQAQGHQEVTAMKIDIEGHEPNVLEPFFKQAA